MSMERMRPLARKSAMYIDVLDIPNIAEAVREASAMLREGILRAMSSNVGEPIPVSVSPGAGQNTGIAKNTSGNGSGLDSAITRADRDPMSIYSAAVAKRPRKPTSPSHADTPQPSGRNPLEVYTAVTKTTRKTSDDTPSGDSDAGGERLNTQPVNGGDPMQTDDPSLKVAATNSELQSSSTSKSSQAPLESALRTWDRDKKAGPSILSKRGRPVSSDPKAPVFQPAPKRERRDGTGIDEGTTKTLTPTTAKVAATKTSTGNALMSDTKKTDSNGHTMNAVTAALANIPLENETTHKVSAEANMSNPTNIKPSLNTNTKAAPFSVPSSASSNLLSPKYGVAKVASSKIVSGKSTSPKATLQKAVSPRAAISKAGMPRATAIAPVTTKFEEKGKEDTIETAEGAAAAMAAAAGNRFASRRGTSMAALTHTATPLGSGSNYISPAMALLRRKMSTGAGRGARDPTGNATTLTDAQHEALARRGGISGVTGGATARNVTLNGSTSGMNVRSSATASASNDVQFVPGSSAIDGVEPNGYTVSDRGVVKPVVTFTNRPRVPLRIRQGILEKLFAVWRNERHASDAVALQNSLRTEQEIYARSAGLVEYRAAMLSKLKAIRSGNG